MKRVVHEKWGRFIENRQYGQVLIVLNEEDGSGNHPVWFIFRHPGFGRIEFKVDFTDREMASRYLERLDEAETDRLIEDEVASYRSAS